MALKGLFFDIRGQTTGQGNNRSKIL